MLANSVVALTAAATTATLALIIEDVFPVGQPRQMSAARWVLLGITVALLLVAIVGRTAIHRRSGTLYYLRLLDCHMPDLHMLALRTAADRRMALRSVTRWVDFTVHTHNEIIDLVQPCSDAAAALELTVNGDHNATAHVIAPNLIWPVALAVGGELPMTDDLRLLELDGRSDREPQEFSLGRLSRRPTLDLAVERQDLVSSSPDSPVGILINLTKPGLLTPENAFKTFAVSRCYKIRPAHLRGQDIPTFSGHELASLVRPLAAALLTLKETAGDRMIIMSAAMPKTVSLALGWELGQSNTRFFHRTHLLHYDKDSTPQFRPVRVHPSQPTEPPPPALAVRP